MIYLFTGAPGASKTLNAIKFISEKLKDRRIYCFNVRELSNGWETIDKETAQKWYDLPDGAVILLDECQELFSPRKNGAEVPEIISRLNTHRHKGQDLILVTQHPMLIDGAVRRVVNEHTHLTRSFGMSYAKKAVWSECVSDPAGSSELARAVVSRSPFDKKYFGAYKSAEMHTAKKRIPTPFIVLAIGSVFVAALAYSFYSRFEHKQEVASLAVKALNDPATKTNHVDQTNDFADSNNPRIAGLPWTAPKYDEIRKPVSWPRPQCMIFRRQCRCYTQQASLMPDIPETFCLAAVKYGYFDDTRPDTSVAQTTQTRAERQEPTAMGGGSSRARLIGTPAKRMAAVRSSQGSYQPTAAKGERYSDALYFD